MSTCQRVVVEESRIDVVVRVPKSLPTRCRECWRASHRHRARFVCTFFWLSMAFLVFGLMWVMIYCQEKPGLSLEAISVSDMVLYQNNTVLPPASPWRVSSGLSVGLAAWNPNRVAGCFATFRRVHVRVEYRGQVIIEQVVPLGFGLPPKSPNRPVAMALQGAGFPLKNPDLGPFMQNELRRDNFSLDFYFDARYLRNDRKAGWLNFGCHVVTRTPSNSSLPGANALLTKDCIAL